MKFILRISIFIKKMDCIFNTCCWFKRPINER